MTLGNKLQYLRKTNGVSQETLAQQLEITRQTISKWELDISQPDIDKIVAISRIFGVSCDYLLKEEIDCPDSKDETGSIHKTGKSLTQIIVGWVLVALGSIGHIAVMVASSIVEVMVPVKTVGENGEIWYTYSSGITDHNYGMFVKEYNLQLLLFLFTVFIVGGFVLLLTKQQKQFICNKSKKICSTIKNKFSNKN